MVLTAVLMATSVDLRFQAALANHLPSFVTNPTRGLERSSAVEDRLASLRGRPRFAPATTDLPELGAAPDFVAGGRWFNSSPLTLGALRGRVVLVDFWTYTCINCLRTLPYVEAWDDRYRAAELTVVGVHTPEFGFEKRAGNVLAAIRRTGVRYPVVQDNDYATWNAYANNVWPAKYLIDATGDVRYVHFGEGEYAQTERAIRALLAEAGRRRLGATARPRHVERVGRQATTETYLGSARAEGFVPVRPAAGTRDYRAARPGSLAQSSFSLGGRWRVDRESARAVRGATITARVVARAVHLVLGSAGGRPRRVAVRLDGRPITPADAGADVHGGVVTVRRQRLYRLVRLRRTEDHVLQLRVDPGVSAYAFTFG